MKAAEHYACKFLIDAGIDGHYSYEALLASIIAAAMAEARRAGIEESLRVVKDYGCPDNHCPDHIAEGLRALLTPAPGEGEVKHV